jgi:Core-2/I-Branching enzyme
MKIAYLVLVHQNPQLLKRAVELLSRDTECTFFIHMDRKSDFQQFSGIHGDSIHWSEQSIPVYWGEFSLVRAAFLLLQQAVKQPECYDYFVLMSGSDYPLRTGSYIRAYLESNSGFEFMNMIRMPAPGFPLSKINTVRYPSDQPICRFATRALAKAGLAQRDARRYLPGLEPYCGSQWWTISRRAAQYVLEFVRDHPEVERFFAKTFTSDEMFFQTILGNSPFRDKIHRNFVFTDWPRGGNHPLELTEKHLNAFESCDVVVIDDEWGVSEALVARKFSDENLGLIDRLDSIIERKDLDLRSKATPSVSGRISIV